MFCKLYYINANANLVIFYFNVNIILLCQFFMPIKWDAITWSSTLNEAMSVSSTKVKKSSSNKYPERYPHLMTWT